MKESRVFGVNVRGDGRFVAWTALIEDDRFVTVGSFRIISDHATEDEAHAATNAAREKYLSAKEEA